MLYLLPADILKRVLGILINNQPNHIRSSKQNLALLQVCRIWRYTGIPLLYKTAYIRITTNRIKTNLDFIQSQSKWQHVTKLHLSVLADSLVMPLVDVLIAKLGKTQLLWGLDGIRKLDVSMDTKWPQEAKAAAAAETAALLIAGMMPQVTHLEFAYSNDANACVLGQNLIGQLAANLTALRTGIPLCLHSMSAELAHLHLSVKPDTVPVLHAINLRALKTLRLLNLPTNFTWGLFAPHQPTVAFDSLCELALLFTDKYAPPWNMQLDPAICKLRFPRLRRLHVDNLPSGFNLFGAEFPDYLASVHVECRMKSVGLLEQLRVKQIGCIRVEQADEDAQDMSLACYKAIGHLFGSRISLHHSALSVSHVSSAITPQVPWSQLIKLQIIGQYEISTVAHLLNQTPRLKQLHMDNIVDNHSLAKPPPINCQLEHLSVDTSQSRNRLKLMDAVLDLITQLPMLKRVYFKTVAIPIVHSWAIVECVEDYVMEGDSGSEDDATDELWLTNLGFFDLYQIPVGVRKIHFYHEAPIPAYDFLARAAKLVCSHSKHLCHVDGLEFSFLPASSLEASELGPVKETVIYNLSMQLINAMPQLTRVETLTRYFHKDDKTMLEFFTNIIQKLAHQLKICRVYFPLELQNTRFSDKLEYMGLTLRPNNIEGIPSMDISTLKSLFFDNMSEDFPWHLFQNPLTPGFIIFNNIRYLYLRCDRQPGDPDKSWSKMTYSDLARYPRFRFPNLKSLNLELCYDSYLYILRDWKATHLDNLHLTGSISHINRFPFKQLQQVNRMSLFISQVDSKHQDTFYNVTNHMLSTVDSFFCHFDMLSIEFSLDPSRISWHNLTGLGLPDDIELSTVIAIVEKLSKLKLLEVGRLAFSGYPKDIEDCESQSWRQLIATPIRTKLRKLDIYQSFTEDKVAFSAAIALYFITCMESLQKVFVNEFVQEQMASKLSLLKCEYPHISNIKIYSGII
ncbi:hypothetical protein LPJ78_004103 [Coemansia sp. RSA 989]|nr:hypothetical protein LPJ78_004103 [Coemansia sp. RSA 989]